MERVDRKKGAASEKTRDDAVSVFTHNPLVPGSSPGGGIPSISIARNDLRPIITPADSSRRSMRRVCVEGVGSTPFLPMKRIGTIIASSNEAIRGPNA